MGRNQDVNLMNWTIEINGENLQRSYALTKSLIIVEFAPRRSGKTCTSLTACPLPLEHLSECMISIPFTPLTDWPLPPVAPLWLPAPYPCCTSLTACPLLLVHLSECLHSSPVAPHWLPALYPCCTALAACTLPLLHFIDCLPSTPVAPLWLPALYRCCACLTASPLPLLHLSDCQPSTPVAPVWYDGATAVPGLTFGICGRGH